MLIDCPNCTGQGTVACLPCQGTGQRKCGCSKGLVAMGSPAGAGYFTCSKCQGTTWYSCGPCQGTGRATCPDCRGAGKIDPEAPPRPRLRPLPIVGAIVAVVVVMLLVASLFAGTTKSHPDKPQASPTAARRSAILTPVLASLKRCARSALTSPPHCPQRAPVGNATRVVWTLHRHSLHGATVTGGGSFYTVRGSALMTLRYDDSSGHPRRKTFLVRYQASVRYVNGHATVSRLEPDKAAASHQ
jgi:hypothetical protein